MSQFWYLLLWLISYLSHCRYLICLTVYILLVALLLIWSVVTLILTETHGNFNARNKNVELLVGKSIQIKRTLLCTGVTWGPRSQVWKDGGTSGRRELWKGWKSISFSFKKYAYKLISSITHNIVFTPKLSSTFQNFWECRKGSKSYLLENFKSRPSKNEKGKNFLSKIIIK